jgi:hypothetical protein
MENIQTQNLFVMMDAVQKAKSKIQNSSKNSKLITKFDNELNAITSEILKRSEF